MRSAQGRAKGFHGRRALACSVIKMPIVGEAPGVSEAPDVLVLIDASFVNSDDDGSFLKYVNLQAPLADEVARRGTDECAERILREVHANVILRCGPVEPSFSWPEIILPDRRDIR